MSKGQELDEFDKMWVSYRMDKKQAEIVRSGYYKCHIYPEPSSEDFFRRFESDLEHAAGVERIVLDIGSRFPYVFGNVEEAAKLARMHDIGEIYIGDIADDGNPEHEQKTENEQVAFLEWLFTQPEEIWEDTYQYYLEFQTCATPRGQALYAADKLEAVLQLLNYELRGMYGDIRSKEKPSERDLEFGRIIGTYNATDVWAYHFKTVVIDQFSADVTLPFLCLLDSAVTDVRGEWFSWWKFWHISNHGYIW